MSKSVQEVCKPGKDLSKSIQKANGSVEEMKKSVQKVRKPGSGDKEYIV